MKDLRNFCLLLLSITLCCSCKKNKDELSFIPGKRQYEMSVEGGINTFFRTQYIRLTKPSIKPGELPVPISKALMTVNDGKSDMIFKETATPGIYAFINNNEPNYNYAYTLTISYNGKTYTAVDTLRQVVNIVDDFLPLSVIKKTGDSYNGTIPKHTFGYVNANKWWINYGDIPAWAPSKFDQLTYYNYTHLLGSPNSIYPLTNLKRTFSLKAEDVVTIYKISLSAGYSKYLYGVFLETDWNGLFSSVPVNVEGNISGNAQGYFSVSDVDFRRYRVKELR